jgi:hypothetical protein
MGELPPFPVDDETLDLLDRALRPDETSPVSSLGAFLTFMSEMGGSDPAAVESESDGIRVMRDPSYHPNDLVLALVGEIRRLRGGGSDG